MTALSQWKTPHKGNGGRVMMAMIDVMDMDPFAHRRALHLPF